MSKDNHKSKEAKAAKSASKHRRRLREPVADQTGELYDVIGDTEAVEKDFHQRWPGLTMRSKRRREWLYLKAVELRRKDQGLTMREAAQLALEALDDLAQRAAAPKIVEHFDATAPTSESIRPSHVNGNAEVAAVRWLAPLRWLCAYMIGRTGERGPTPGRLLVWAVFLQMAFGRIKPDIAYEHERFLAGHTLLSWAHDYPNRLGYSATCDGVHKMLGARSSRALVHVNLDLFKQLTSAQDAKGKPLHPDAARYCAIDGCLIEADLEQKPGLDDGHRRQMKGRRRRKADRVAYTRKGNVVRFCFGYKLMAIIDLATTLPLVWSLVPANASEHKEAQRLLRILFEAWPECPMEALVGDAAYDESKDFAHALVFDWGVQPVFHRGKNYAKTLPHVATDGIPVCGCGQPMVFKDTDGYVYTAGKRAGLGIPRGQTAPRLDGRLRWNCRNGRCKGQSTRPVDDPRLYTFFHRAGEHKWAILRTVLLLRRNAVESVFASLKNMGLGGRACDRPGWASDDEMDWLLSAGLLYMTARRLAHQSGMYERALAESEALGLLKQPSVATPAPGPDAATLRKFVRDRMRFIDPGAAPSSWFDGDGPGWFEEVPFAALAGEDVPGRECHSPDDGTDSKAGKTADPTAATSEIDERGAGSASDEDAAA